MTETILHGYQIILLPRQTGAHEVIITTPDGVTRRFNGHDLERWTGRLKRELKVTQVALEILHANIQPGATP